MIDEGEPAPDLQLRDDAGRDVRLSDYRGRRVILFFYPRDDTPGCTTEACEFRDAYDRFRERGVEVIGVSPDDVASHARFKAKYELPFTLLADPEHEAAEAFGVWKERKNYGRTYMGVERSTFVIDEDGRVAKAQRGVKPAGHAARLLSEL
jgi:thioredoxin-dependent peroxiredoxin